MTRDIPTNLGEQYVADDGRIVGYDCPECGESHPWESVDEAGECPACGADSNTDGHWEIVEDRPENNGEIRLPDGQAHTITADEFFKCLSNSRRRIIVILLGKYGCEVTANELAALIAAHENDTHPNELRAQAHKRVYIALIQGHLKTLADADLIEYDTRSKRVQPTDYCPLVAGYVDVGCERFSEDSDGLSLDRDVLEDVLGTERLQATTDRRDGNDSPGPVRAIIDKLGTGPYRVLEGI